MSFTIIKESQPHKQKTLIYGLAGVGKSTLAAQTDRPLFVDIEGGLTNMDAPRTPTIRLYSNALRVLDEIHNDAANYLKEYHTIVIDSIDWLCRKAEEHASGVVHVSEGKLVYDMTATIGKANGGYGKGVEQLENHLRAELMPRFDTLVADGFGVVLIAHTDQKDQLSGDGFTTTKLTPSINKRHMEPWVQWCDNVFYLRSENGERKLLLEGTDTILAKNRLGLVGEVDLATTDIKTILGIEKENK